VTKWLVLCPDWQPVELQTIWRDWQEIAFTSYDSCAPCTICCLLMLWRLLLSQAMLTTVTAFSTVFAQLICIHFSLCSLQRFDSSRESESLTISPPLCHNLYRLPVWQCIEFKQCSLCLCMWCTIIPGRCVYMSLSASHHRLCSDLITARTRLIRYGPRSFAVSDPMMWNYLIDCTWYVTDFQNVLSST